MSSIVRTRLLSFIAGLIIVPIGTVLVILFAKGYRPNLQSGQITITGILSTHTYPENARILINGQAVASVTNANINLSPGNYVVEFQKEGYFPWKKDLVIEKEIVTSATAVLFPSVPTLKLITSQPATHVTLAPDGTKVAFLSKNNQVFTLDLSESPLGILNRDSRPSGSLPSGLSPTGLQLIWSPDSRYILATSAGNKAAASASAYFIDPGSQQVTSATATLSYLLQSWKDRQNNQDLQKFNSLPPVLKQVLATASANLTWAPRENKILYTATASATLPDQIIKPLPGSSTQPQIRELVPGQTYVYDLEEDRNFNITQSTPPSPTPAKSGKSIKSASPASRSYSSSALYTGSLIHPSGWAWFPTSSHLYRIENNQITVVEYDNQNSTVVYSGPLFENTAIPYPSGKQMLLLTSFVTTPAASASAQPELYALTLR